MPSFARTTADPQEVAQSLPVVATPMPPGASPFPPYVLTPGTQIPTYTNTPAVPFLPTPKAAPQAPQVIGQANQPATVIPGATAPQAAPKMAPPMNASMAATQGNYAASLPEQNGVVSAGRVQ